MPEELLDQTIIGHLAARDIPCLTCGYNLRGSKWLHCAECGRPIIADDIGLPEPELPKLERLTRYLRGRDIKCKCGYNLRDLQTNECPECGRTYQLMGGPRRSSRPQASTESGKGCLIILLFVLLALILIAFIIASISVQLP